jgi:hypothetical protein
MKITRRNFIRTSGTVVMAAGLLGPVGAILGRSRAAGDNYALPSDSLSDPVLYFTRAHFAPYVNTTMRVSDGKRVLDLRLVDVPDLTLAANQKKGYSGENFSLILAAPGRKKMTPGLYTFEHPALGTFTLNLNVVDRPDCFEAVINRVNR